MARRRSTLHKLIRFLRPRWPHILLILALLGLQAWCDLSLPTYTARIINIGIQQGGIANAQPDMIRASTLDAALIFLDPEERTALLADYRRLEPGKLPAEDGVRLLADYPRLAEEAAYQRVAPATPAAATRFELPLLATFFFSQDSPELAAAEKEIRSRLPAETADIALLDLLPRLPEAALTPLRERLGQFPEQMISQGAIQAVRAESAALGVNMERLQTRTIATSGLQMLSLALLSMLTTILVVFLSARTAAWLGRDLRGRVFGRVVTFSQSEMDRFTTASLITRSTNDIQQIQMMLVMLLRMVFYAPIMATGGVLRVMATNRSMTWIIALAVSIILIIVLAMFLLAVPRFKRIQKLIDNLNRVIREQLTGLPVIRAFTAERREEKRFDGVNTILTGNMLFVSRTMSMMMPVIFLVMNTTTLLIIWAGGHEIADSRMKVGELMAFISYAMQIIMSFLMISMTAVMLPRASVSAGRIAEVLETADSVVDPPDPVPPAEPARGEITFENVTFRYPSAAADVLSGISFVARPGQTTAIIGGTGSGKSTVLSLILRFHDATSGRILFDGIDIRRMSRSDLRRRIGYVPQTAVLFSGTIAENLRYGRRDATVEEIKRGASIAQAETFILQRDEGFEDAIAQGGTNVSGGQKQRLSIARAIVRNPAVYLFDDSFSALDYRTDAALREALRRETAQSTVIVVAQRVSTILSADQILVLEAGRIVGQGTHRELLASCEVYRQIASSQLSEAELSA